MQIKRFEAKTMTAALKMVKEEFGPNAVILTARSRRSGRGIFSAGAMSGVEVTAAKDSDAVTYTAAGSYAVTPAPERIAPQTAHGRRGLFQSLNQGLRSLAARRQPAESVASDVAAAPELAEFYQHLLAQDLERELATELIDHLKQLPGYDHRFGTEHLRPQLAGILQDMGLRRADSTPRPRALVLVGPAGVGKTTTAIKLAADLRLQQHRAPAILTIDDVRIGAIEQLRTYAAILGVPLAVATSPEETRRALKDLGAADTLIVDTPGISPGEADRRSALRPILETLPSREVHLVLSAAGREKDLRRVVDAWKGVGIHRLLFTRLDETGTWGSVLNLMVGTQLPVSWVSTGPRVPEDLVTEPLELLLDRMLPASPAGAVRNEHPGDERRGPIPPGRSHSARFVANRNSELYHLPGCKWVRKIKSDNLISFATVSEAESRRFLPCRNCCPDQPEQVDDNAVVRERTRISGYR
ncbi:MAG TPA: flagellar biosynthesis protein FlhF [Desulfobacterales bacterium]|nr:flagellar biosynthesis protein FlhF [Desulfobacterales bacterium]